MMESLNRRLAQAERERDEAIQRAEKARTLLIRWVERKDPFSLHCDTLAYLAGEGVDSGDAPHPKRTGGS